MMQPQYCGKWAVRTLSLQFLVSCLTIDGFAGPRGAPEGMEEG
jgi:hypothetical protein